MLALITLKRLIVSRNLISIKMKTQRAAREFTTGFYGKIDATQRRRRLLRMELKFAWLNTPQSFHCWVARDCKHHSFCDGHDRKVCDKRQLHKEKLALIQQTSHREALVPFHQTSTLKLLFIFYLVFIFRINLQMSQHTRWRESIF